MKICVDVQTALSQPTGVGRYTIELVQHLCNIVQSDELLLFYFDFLGRNSTFKISQAANKTVKWAPERILRRCWRILKWPPFDVFSGTSDIYHFPNFILPPLRYGKSVVTIHDLSFLRFPEYARTSYARYLTYMIQDTAARADVIVTDSIFCKNEIQLLLNVDAKRLFPVYPGISSEFYKRNRESVKPVLANFNIDRPYILIVGTIEPRKNITFLIEVFEQLDSFDGDPVIVGKLGWKYEQIIKRIYNSRRADSIRYLKYVDFAELPLLYSGAELFVFSSFYEGFGFPPLEAMACGVPVVSSASGSLSEVLGEGAKVIHEYDRDKWVAAIQEILFNSNIRNHQIAAGFHQVQNYTWYKCASRILQIYKYLV